MTLALQIIGWWVVLSFTLGPAIAWWNWRHERRERALRAKWKSTHPTTPWGLMPADIAGAPKQATDFSRELIQ